MHYNNLRPENAQNSIDQDHYVVNDEEHRSIQARNRKMAEPSLELIQTMVQRVLDQVSELRGDMVEVKERLGLLELSNASLSRRVDRMSGDIDLIKRRLDLVPAA